MSGSAFWEAYELAWHTTRQNVLGGLVSSAESMRAAHRYPPEHVVRAEVPGWVFETLTEDDRLGLANDHNIHVVRAVRGG